MLINDQLAYKEIADVLNLSRKTVEAQIAIAYKKLSVVLKQIYLPAILLLFILKSF
jgi:DNA-binding CsgD family transcriptional regulator